MYSVPVPTALPIDQVAGKITDANAADIKKRATFIPFPTLWTPPIYSRPPPILTVDEDGNYYFIYKRSEEA